MIPGISSAVVLLVMFRPMQCGKSCEECASQVLGGQIGVFKLLALQPTNKDIEFEILKKKHILQVGTNKCFWFYQYN